MIRFVFGQKLGHRSFYPSGGAPADDHGTPQIEEGIGEAVAYATRAAGNYNGFHRNLF